MNLLGDALAWLADPAHWTGTKGIVARALEHVGVAALVLSIAAALAIPAGVFVGHTGRARGIVTVVSGGVRAIPTLGLLTVLALWFGIGLEAPIVALVVLAIPSLLAGAYSGVEAVDRAVVDAVRALGHDVTQVIAIEMRLAAPLILGGVRSAALQVVATTTLAAYIADVGLGRYLFSGLKSRQYDEMLGGALVVTALALVVELLLAAAQSRARRSASPVLSQKEAS
ncbi:ABC transporter permease [Microbacterium sp. NPDC055683]